MGDLAEAISGEDALPNSYLPGDERGQDPASLLKSYLPSTRARLAYLKARESDPITDSPLEMGDIIQGYYEELWSEDPGLRSKKDKPCLSRPGSLICLKLSYPTFGWSPCSPQSRNTKFGSQEGSSFSALSCSSAN